jgi:16S rRNA (uracil1498-N3)-methyltransferase
MQVFLIENAKGQSGRLHGEETRHCRKVLRHEVGDEIHGVDGQGHYFRARIEAFEKDETRLRLLDRVEEWGEHGGSLCLGVSPLRLRDRFEFVIEKAVELGATHIVPLSCARTDKYKAKFKPERLHTLLLTALKQCKRSRLPELWPLTPLDDWLAQPLLGPGYLAYCDDDLPRQPLAQALSQHPQRQATLLIGPEGDFTPDEARQAQAAGYQPITLGDNRLRTETAAMHALSLVKGSWGY